MTVNSLRRHSKLPPYPPPTPAPIPSAVDPHTVERAWFRASRWSAPPYERPGRPGPRLLGFAWVDGGRDGSTPRTPQRARGRRWRPLHPGAGRSPAGGIVFDRAPFYTVIDSWLSALSTMWARVGAARAERAEGRSVARSGAGKRARRSGAQPGLDEVEKPVTALARFGSGRRRVSSQEAARESGFA